MDVDGKSEDLKLRSSRRNPHRSLNKYSYI